MILEQNYKPSAIYFKRAYFKGIDRLFVERAGGERRGECEGGVMGRVASPVLHKLLTSMHAPFTVAEANAHLCGVLLEVDSASGRCLSIQPVDLPEGDIGHFSHEFVQR